MPTLTSYFDKMTPARQATWLSELEWSGATMGFHITPGEAYTEVGPMMPGARRAKFFMPGTAEWMGLRTAGRGIKEAAGLGAKGAWGKAFAVGGKGLAKAAGKGFAPGLGLYFTGTAALEGYRQGGVTGAISGGLREAAINLALFAGIRALGPHGALVLAGGAAVAGAGLALGYGFAKGAEASWQYHMRNLPLETTGSLSAFSTGGAATMRQRSLMNIQRSHLNARSAFGNEAQYAHLARYRGVGRRGLM